MTRGWICKAALPLPLAAFCITVCSLGPRELSMGYIEIEQIGSPIRRRRDQRQTLIGLKLNKIGRVSWLPDIASVRGMIRKVRHLVRITHKPSAPKSAPPAAAPDEAADVQPDREATDVIVPRHGVRPECVRAAQPANDRQAVRLGLGVENEPGAGAVRRKDHDASRCAPPAQRNPSQRADWAARTP